MPRPPRYAVVLAGGSGSRFWPRSRLRMPKQLLPILGARTMLQETVARLSPLVARDRMRIVTGREHARAVRAQLPGFGSGQLLVEPEGRNTAAAIALAALGVARECDDALITVLPADHAIDDAARFRSDLGFALDVAERTGALVTLGLRPTRPETGYGYVRAGRAVPGTSGRAAWVEAFVEKPDRARAAALLAGGRVLWNSGIFAWRASAILAALRTHLPALVAALERALGRRDPKGLAAAYRRLPAVSIDTGVLERAARVAVVRARFAWADVGSWAALEAFWRTGGNGGNAVRGRALPIDSRGCVVDSPRRLVALVGVDDLVVVDSPDALLVCRKDRAQDVRLVVEELRRRGLERYL
ncbi:MAG: mannose-1-phosphate guanyltransferase [Deltaproteobacteria bacterium]|nr:MAG: mannose-1-phosphate guanyltransferase [Deltaproteobacteria bacterium]